MLTNIKLQYNLNNYILFFFLIYYDICMKHLDYKDDF